MKKMSLLLTAILFALTGILAQSPDEFKYQAVLRSGDGTIMEDENVTVYIEIIQGSAGGTSIFNETHNLTTTAQGLINLNIGSVNDLSIVNWSADSYFIKITVNGTEMGTSQVLSVPYALHAKTSGTHYIGELYGGGIIFFIDHTGEHGLIASLEDLDGGSGVAWSNITNTLVGAGAQDAFDGASNTAAIIAQSGHTNSAAKLCDDYENDGFTDWYLPTTSEILLLRQNQFTIHYILENDGNPDTYGLLAPLTAPYSFYWSSYEIGDDLSWYLGIEYPHGTTYNKVDLLRVRAIRDF